MAISYSLPLKITTDEDTGLLLLVDSTGKTLSRGASPTIVNNLGLEKGVKSTDLPAPVDPREPPPAPTPPPASKSADTAASTVQNQTGTETEQPLSSTEAARVKENKTNAPQEATPDAGDEFGNSRKVTLGAGVLEAQSASNTVDTAASNKKIEVGTNRTVAPTVGTNLLHQFASYTYNISLHMLSKEDFNKMGRDPDSNWVPSKTLIGGAGKWGVPGFNRDQNFLDDFYFDNLKMTTIIGSTAGNQGTNAVELNFTIIEPHGVTLLDRLIDACLDPAVDGKNYLEIPYLIQIDFFGYDDEGIGKHLVKQRKYIPINILTMSIKASIKGAEYQMSAVPYAHSGFQESVAATPANFEITASTLQEFFKDIDDANDAKAADKENQRLEAEKKAKEKEEKTNPDKNNNTRKTDKETSSASGNDTSTPTYTVKSYVSAYNAWGRASVENKHATDYNRIAVVIDDFILKAANGNGGKIVNPKNQPTSQVSEYNPKNKKELAAMVRANAGKPTAQPNLGFSKFNVTGQTSVMAVINNIMLSSEYIRSQMIDTTKDASQNAEDLKKPINWWKIIPDVKLRKYDPQNGKWFMDITYYVKPYTVYNRVHPNAPKDLPKGWHREYNYIYTGQNNDIIDFSIDFDTAFYTAVTIDRTRVAATLTQAGPDIEGSQVQNPNPSVEDLKKGAFAGFQPKTTVPKSDNLAVAGQATNRKDGVGMATASVAEHFNNGQSADQLAIKLKIIGDPQFIKQDEIYYSPAARRYSEVQGQPSNFVTDESSSIAMDNGEVHIRLNWKTPVDIDEETGGLKTNTKYFQSSFSGIFQVLMVESTFAQGKFEQMLDAVRLPDQPDEKQNVEKSSTDIRADNLPSTAQSGTSQGWAALDSQTVEQQKTTVLTGLLQNKTTSTSVERNSNIQKVDTTPEADARGYGEEYQNSQARALSSVRATAPTQTASDFFGT